jgi:hypothetical protein
MAYTDVTIGNLDYRLNGVEAYVIGYIGSPTEVVIPSTIQSNGQTFKVTQISSSAFYKSYTSSINKITVMGNNLWSIGSSAFKECTQLKEINIPNVTKIESNAFLGCTNLKKIVLGKVESIGSYAFQNCNNLPYIVVPASCTSIGHDIFYGCDRLQTIIYCGEQTGKYSSNADVYNINNMVTWSANTFTYSGSAPKPSFTCKLPAGFSPTSYYVPTLENNVGSYSKKVPINFDNGETNFSVDITYNYTINPAKLIARVKDATRQYGDADPKFQTEYSGFVGNDNASVITSNGTYYSDATILSDIGSYPITQSGATSKNYTFEYENGTLRITKAPLTITAKDKTMTYGDKLPILEVEYAGLKNNESEPVWINEPIITTTATSTCNAGTYYINVSGGLAKNYSVFTKSGKLTVSKAPLTVTIKSSTRVYGDDNPNFELDYMEGLKFNEVSPEWIVNPTFHTSANKTSPVGTYDITASGGEARNYTLQSINNGTLTVSKALLTATARSCYKKQGQSNPSFIIDYSGFKNNETKSVLIKEPVANTTAAISSPVGTYPITLSGGEALNYDFNYVNGTLTVTNQEVMPPYTLGDVDGNGSVSITDAVLIVNYIIGKPNSTFIKDAADLDGNGQITITDKVLLINKYILNKQ